MIRVPQDLIFGPRRTKKQKKKTLINYLRSKSIMDVSVDIASERDAGFGKAELVEQCKCPYEYSGLSCEVIMVIRRKVDVYILTQRVAP